METTYVFLQQAANKFKMKFSVMYKNNTGLCLELEACFMLEWAIGYSENCQVKESLAPWKQMLNTWEVDCIKKKILCTL